MIDEPKRPGPVAASEDAYVVSPGAALSVLRRRLWVVPLVAALCVAAAVAYGLLQTPRYEASVLLLIAQEEGGSGTLDDVSDLQQLTQTMARAVDSRPVAEAAAGRLGLRASPESVLADLDAEQVPETQFIRVEYAHPDPETARRVADAVGEEFSSQVSKVSPTANVTATLWERAATPQSPASPRPARDGLLALMLGGMLGLGLASLLGYLDDRCRTPEEAQRASGAPVLGVLPGTGRRRRSPFGRRRRAYAGSSGMGEYPGDPTTPAAEAYRSLRSGLLYATGPGSAPGATDRPRTVVVTSPGPEGRNTEVCANLGAVLARAGRRTLVVDCDLRAPSMHRLFETGNTSGFADVLAGERGLREVWREPLPGLKLVTAGRVPQDPTELLSSGRFAEVLGRARGEFEYVLIFTPPVSTVSDAAIVAAQVDGVLLVVDGRTSRRAAVRQSASVLRSFGAVVLGTVLTGVQVPGRGRRGAMPHRKGSVSTR